MFTIKMALSSWAPCFWRRDPTGMPGGHSRRHWAFTLTAASPHTPAYNDLPAHQFCFSTAQKNVQIWLSAQYSQLAKEIQIFPCHVLLNIHSLPWKQLLTLSLLCSQLLQWKRLQQQVGCLGIPFNVKYLYSITIKLLKTWNNLPIKRVNEKENEFWILAVIEVNVKAPISYHISGYKIHEIP